MIFGSLFSGIEAASVAWQPLGWRCAWTAEIDPFASALLAYRYPGVPNLGDVNAIDPAAVEPVDLVVFGSPCQSFSVAGKRLGLDDPRGNMALVGLRVVGRIRPRWVVWENVPGVLSSDGGRDFGAFLGLLGELGYGFAYRVLDAQHFGVPQRRRRVFVVGHLGDWRAAAAVLFEPESLRGDSPPRREARQGVAAKSLCSTGGGIDREDRHTLIAYGGNRQSGPHGRLDFESETFVAHSLRADGFDAGEDGTGRGTPLVTHALDSYSAGRATEDGTGRGAPLTLAIRGRGDSGSLQQTSASNEAVGRPENGQSQPEYARFSVRRLTPRECERLQGFPDDYTLIPYRGKPVADGPRYRAIGNSFAVPVVRWIGERIQLFEARNGIGFAAD